MYKIIILTILVTLLNAQNPKPYSALGDVIYDNVQKIDSLKKIKYYKVYIKDIKAYVKDVKKTKKIGFEIESGKSKNSNKEYLNKLRELSKRNDYFMRSAVTSYDNAVKNQDSTLFAQLINSGLIDTQSRKQEIIDYYFLHSEDINIEGVIQEFLDEDAKLKAKKEAEQKRYKTKKQREAAKIKRIRENDRAAQERLERELELELSRKKMKIREDQKLELVR
ncbi:hypothetical protein GJV85_01715 [Sulfurimonas aquatica]|uniref:Uncharacterized protein n=1 Tax=Sulfurimonas aquatica TaxID=2672570 RepID=A0A975GBN8_9BACT|nr:hypothetical protein [Sulfurimonas aquatica]QSZ40881.1 hypothetical protein GJV85_01715 [Sulfurimonas aquatica]